MAVKLGETWKISPVLQIYGYVLNEIPPDQGERSIHEAIV